MVAAGKGARMEFGAHLPLIDTGSGYSLAALKAYAAAASRLGYRTLCANDHLLFARPWLDGPTALAAVLEESGQMTLATTVSLPVIRGPAQLAKTLAALDLLSDGRLVAGLGPGSSAADYEAAGVPFGERWPRFDESITALRSLLGGDEAAVARHYPTNGVDLRPQPRRLLPLWVASWGSPAGLRRVARLGDGWLASAYNTTPEGFVAARKLLGDELGRRRRSAGDFPHALVTMWTWITDKRADAERVLTGMVGPLVGRDPAELRGRVCVGPAHECAELLSRYARAGCQRVHFWPVDDERRQIELIAGEVMPRISG